MTEREAKRRCSAMRNPDYEITETKVPYLRLFTNLKRPVMTTEEAVENYKMLPDEYRAEITAMIMEALKKPQYRDEP
jgi:hypothetical protein